jgi:uncharacterized membrane protein
MYGVISGLGMWLVMTLLGVLSLALCKKQIIRFAAKMWSDIKNKALEFDSLRAQEKGHGAVKKK